MKAAKDIKIKSDTKIDMAAPEITLSADKKITHTSKMDMEVKVDNELHCTVGRCEVKSLNDIHLDAKVILFSIFGPSLLFLTNFDFSVLKNDKPNPPDNTN